MQDIAKCISGKWVDIAQRARKLFLVALPTKSANL
jgi:hypothetical protein